MRQEVEFWSIVCPRGGNHIVQNVLWLWPDDAPDHEIPGRACIKCGLRDTFIEESE